MANDEMKKYDFIEGIDFEGLEPKAMEGYSVGKSDVNVHLFYGVRGADALEVISINKLFEASSQGGSDDSGSTIDSGSTESGSTESGSTESGSTESCSTESGYTIDSGST